MFSTFNPTTNEKLADYNYLTPTQIELNLNKAVWQLERQQSLSQAERCEILHEIANALKAQKRILALQMAYEMGKPLVEGEAEVLKSAMAFEYYAQHLPAILAEEPIPGNYSQVVLSKKSMGCVLGIMPWNFPLWQWARHAAPLIGAGGISLLKHADIVSGFAQMLTDLIDQVCSSVLFNLRIDHQQVARLIADSRVQGVSFTGSVRGGREVALLCAQNLKKSVLELGGNDAYLVWHNADLQLAAEVLAKARFVNAGQVCIAAKRFIVHKSIAEEFLQRFATLAKNIKVGDPIQTTTQMGPLAGQRYKAELQRQIQQAQAAGASYTTLQAASEYGACYADIGLLQNLPTSKEWSQQEVFGPVAQIYEVNELAEALKIMNGSPFALGAGVFSKDISWAQDIAKNQIKAGFVAINDFVKTDPRVPFGGTGESGWGKELGELGALEFVNIKTVATQLY